MICSENRFPLFRIMLYDISAAPLTAAAGARFMASESARLRPDSAIIAVAWSSITIDAHA
jgi:hypothetical protein